MREIHSLSMQKSVSARRKKERQLCYMLIYSINVFNIITNNATKLSKVLINGTSLRSSHSLEIDSKLKDSLLRVLCMNGALPHPLHPPFQVLDVGILLIPSFVYFNCFLHSRGVHEVDYYRGDFGGHFWLIYLPLNCLDLF